MMDQQSTSGSQTIDNNYNAASANNVKEAPSAMEQDHLHSTKQNSIRTGETTTP